jgi:hypothetical protein
MKKEAPMKTAFLLMVFLPALYVKAGLFPCSDALHRIHQTNEELARFIPGRLYAERTPVKEVKKLYRELTILDSWLVERINAEHCDLDHYDVQEVNRFRNFENTLVRYINNPPEGAEEGLFDDLIDLGKHLYRKLKEETASQEMEENDQDMQAATADPTEQTRGHGDRHPALRHLMNDTLHPLLETWNQANSLKRPSILEDLYAPELTYYGKWLSRQEVLADKRRFFRRYPYFKQRNVRFNVIKLGEDLYKIRFDKLVTMKPGAGERTYPSYLVVDTSSGDPKIVNEGDYVTDWNLKKRRTHARMPTLRCGQVHTLQGQAQIAYGYGSPGFGEDPTTDAIIGTYILRLDTPIHVLDNGRECNYGEDITAYEVQLVPMDETQSRILDRKALSNQQVRVRGTFFTADNLHHKRKLLLELKGIE